MRLARTKMRTVAVARCTYRGIGLEALPGECEDFALARCEGGHCVLCVVDEMGRGEMEGCVEVNERCL